MYNHKFDEHKIIPFSLTLFNQRSTEDSQGVDPYIGFNFLIVRPPPPPSNPKLVIYF